MDNYYEHLSLSADELFDAEWVYGSGGKKYLKAKISFNDDQKHVLTTSYYYPKKPYGSLMCMCMSNDSCQKFFQTMQRYKKGGYKEMLPYIEHSWPRLVRSIKNGWEKHSFDVCSLNKVHDFENPSRPFVWVFCKSLSWMPTPESFEDEPDESKAEELMNSLLILTEEITKIDKEIDSGLKTEDKIKIELVRARNGLLAGIALGAFRSFISDIPDITSALLENNPEEVISF